MTVRLPPWTSVGVMCALTLVAAHAQGGSPADAKQECVSAYESGQRMKQRGALLEAREQFLSCAQPTCPEALASDCSRFLDEVELDIPSVVLSAVALAGLSGLRTAPPAGAGRRWLPFGDWS